ncbi:P-loop containing nucleoside triphosphate hydrolase protein [Phaeosphaeria sp. MPI-PUGE-AT-0046c]|nr:P-loop containing nucleoside triphosphate hydrolase protein [Phaeosphaeria sp. MPI-PUGE-AT-0046c]
MHFKDIFKRKKAAPLDKAEAVSAISDDDENDQWTQMQSESLVLVMGVTGAGKSYFINKLKPNSVAEGHGIASQTKSCKLVQMQLGAYTVAAVDTPGFDDDEDSDAAVLAKISRFLIAQHLLGIKLKGIIFLHSINTVRFSGSHKRYLDTFRRLCGEEAFKNVALVTTMWERENHDTKYQRDAALQSGPWADLIAKGAYVFQYDGTSDMAQTIVRLLMIKKETVLQIQKELTEDRGKLECTTAGADLASELDKKLEACQKEIQSLRQQKETAEQRHDDTSVKRLQAQIETKRQKQIKQMKSRDALRPKLAEETDKSIKEADQVKRTKGERWRNRLQIFVTVLSPIVGIAAHFLIPLAGA